MVVGGKRRHFAAVAGQLLLVCLIQAMQVSRTGGIGRLLELIVAIQPVNGPQGHLVEFFLPGLFGPDAVQPVAFLVVVGLLGRLGRLEQLFLHLLYLRDLLAVELHPLAVELPLPAVGLPFPAVGLLGGALAGQGVDGAQVGYLLDHGIDVLGQFLQVEEGVCVVRTHQPLLVQLLLHLLSDVLSDVLVVVGPRALQL